MIVRFNYEEISALKAGAQVCLQQETTARGAVVATTERLEQVEALVPRLDGDLSLATLGELRAVQAGVEAIVCCLRVEMEASVAATHAADEGAVAAYFDFAHAFSVAHRLRELASEMEAMIELVTGEEPTLETSATFRFPD